MDLLQLLLVVALAVAAVAYLIISRKSDYKKQLDQLKPEPAGKAKKWVKPTEMKLFTAEEVAKHNKSDDAWIIVRDRQTGVSKVYDVTSYVDEHPGGESILNNAGGAWARAGSGCGREC